MHQWTCAAGAANHQPTPSLRDSSLPLPWVLLDATPVVSPLLLLFWPAAERTTTCLLLSIPCQAHATRMHPCTRLRALVSSSLATLPYCFSCVCVCARARAHVSLSHCTRGTSTNRLITQQVLITHTHTHIYKGTHRRTPRQVTAPLLLTIHCGCVFCDTPSPPSLPLSPAALLRAHRAHSDTAAIVGGVGCT